MKKHVTRAVVGSIVAILTLTSALATTSGASDVDLGPVETVQDLVDSPEYRSWHADVLRLYRAFFDRTPDAPGATYWVDIYEDGASLDDLAWNFSNSEEFKATYGGSLSNADFLTIVYSNVLGRAPDQGGFDYWLGQMNNGLSQSGVVRWVVANDEFINRFPYTPTGTPLRSFLLSPAQVVGFVADYEIPSIAGPITQPQPANACVVARVWPKNAEAIGYDIGSDRSLYQLVYQFSSVAAAQEFMARARSVPAACDQMSFGDLQMSVTSTTGPDLGDEMVANYHADALGRTDYLHWKEIYVRHDDLVYVIDVSTYIGISPNIADTYAQAASAHVEALLS